MMVYFLKNETKYRSSPCAETGYLRPFLPNSPKHASLESHSPLIDPCNHLDNDFRPPALTPRRERPRRTSATTEPISPAVSPTPRSPLAVAARVISQQESVRSTLRMKRAAEAIALEDAQIMVSRRTRSPFEATAVLFINTLMSSSEYGQQRQFRCPLSRHPEPSLGAKVTDIEAETVHTSRARSGYTPQCGSLASVYLLHPKSRTGLYVPPHASKHMDAEQKKREIDQAASKKLRRRWALHCMAACFSSTP